MISMTPRREYGFFAIPETRVKELRRLRTQALQAFDERRDDWVVVDNEVYRRAAEVSVYHAVVPLHSSSYAAYDAVMETLCRVLRLDDGGHVFTVEEARTIMDGMRAWRRHVGGEDGVVERMQRGDRGVSITQIRDVFRTFECALTVAEQRGAGFIAASLSFGAEQRLDDRRAHDERLRQLVARESPGDTRPLDPNDAEVFLSPAWLERHNARYPTPEPRKPSPGATHESPCKLAVVPGRYASHLHKLIRQAARMPDMLDTIQARLVVQTHALATATRVFELTRNGEVATVSSLIVTAARYGAPKPAHRDYTVRQSRRFACALHAWRAVDGLDGVIDELIALFPEAKTRALCASAYRAFVDAFDLAADTRCAVFISP